MSSKQSRNSSKGVLEAKMPPWMAAKRILRLPVLGKQINADSSFHQGASKCPSPADVDRTTASPSFALSTIPFPRKRRKEDFTYPVHVHAPKRSPQCFHGNLKTLFCLIQAQPQYPFCGFLITKRGLNWEMLKVRGYLRPVLRERFGIPATDQNVMCS